MALLIWVPVLLFALYKAEERSTKIWIVFCIALNLVGAGWMFIAGDADRFAAFERAWTPDEPAYHAD